MQAVLQVVDNKSQLDNDDGGGDGVDAGGGDSDDGGAEYFQLSPKQTDGKFRAAVIVWGKVAAKLFIGPPSETNFENPKLAPGIFEANFLLVLSKCQRYFYADVFIFCSFSGVFAC